MVFNLIDTRQQWVRSKNAIHLTANTVADAAAPTDQCRVGSKVEQHTWHPANTELTQPRINPSAPSERKGGASRCRRKNMVGRQS